VEAAKTSRALVEHIGCRERTEFKGRQLMANAKKWRKKKMAKHKHRKRLKKTRWQRRQRNN
jgi:hypothetical protein